ncbi:SRPBCC family protein [Flavobacteriaceae bacterium F89]|uniref:SRPBCC family protein n=1 Tax=Cerina litoralis TaxID=2874477 RepID=A0AAE3EWH0_9FLAO|nr:SRPBCC family protein [Cerina litoralis]MCG2462158.1 SRPBCC family protein [Cerina litoralis]
MERITVKTKIQASAKMVWDLWTGPEHIVKWNTASDDWHTTKADNDLRVGGKFRSRMEAKDGSFGFDFSGTYISVEPYKSIAYTMDDGRKAEVDFKENIGETEIVTVFDAESQNPIEMQSNGWQAILDNFKKYVENF